jgi:hypothetical protein
MEFVLTFNQPIEEIERHEDPQRGSAAMEPWKVYMGEMVAAGVLRGGNRLAPPWTATTVRSRGGLRMVQDGPFAETKELAAGYVVIDVASLDEALQWAEKSPSTAIGSTEVRPVARAPQ